MQLKKRKASAVLVIVMVAAVASTLIAISMAKVTQASTSSLNSGKIALSAQHFATSKAELVEAQEYSKLTAQSKTAISNSNGFFDEVIIGSETNYPADSRIKQKQCIVNVYKDNESLPRHTLRFMRYSVSSASSVPKGTIIPWYGNLNSIPSGFALCNGQNGTPDLRNRFIVGAGSSYGLGSTGGANTVTLSYAQMPKHAHSRGTMNITGTAEWASDDGGSTGCFYRIGYNNCTDSGGQRQQTIGFDASRSWTGVTSYEGSSQAHENRPPYYALYYLMKL